VRRFRGVVLAWNDTGINNTNFASLDDKAFGIALGGDVIESTVATFIKLVSNSTVVWNRIRSGLIQKTDGTTIWVARSCFFTFARSLRL